MRVEKIELGGAGGAGADAGGAGGASLTAYLLDEPARCAVTPRPAVIVCPGGAYTHLADREGEPVAMAFAAAGCQAFVLRYTLGSPEPGRAAFPDCLDELARSVALVRERAGEFDVDPGRVYACGFSAGGHLALMLATTWDEVAGRLGVDPELVRLNGTIACYPLTDNRIAAAALADPDSGLDPHARVVLGQAACAMFGRSDPPLEEVEALSPVCLVDARTAPAFIWTTAEDKTVDPLNSLRYAAALSAAHVPFELHVFETGPHGMSLAGAATRGLPDNPRVNADAAQWVGLALRWLDRRPSR